MRRILIDSDAVRGDRRPHIKVNIDEAMINLYEACESLKDNPDDFNLLLYHQALYEYMNQALYIDRGKSLDNYREIFPEATKMITMTNVIKWLKESILKSTSVNRAIYIKMKHCLEKMNKAMNTELEEKKEAKKDKNKEIDHTIKYNTSKKYKSRHAHGSTGIAKYDNINYGDMVMDLIDYDDYRIIEEQRIYSILNEKQGI